MYVAGHEDSKLTHYKERFQEDDVENAFLYLLEMLEALWSEVDIQKLTKVCKRDIRLSNELKTDLKNATNLDETFDLLTNSPFCSWLEIRILKRMAKAANIPEAMELIEAFEECVHSRKCSEVELHFMKQYINPDHLTSVIAKFNKNPEHLVVADLIKYCRKLETILKLPDDSSAPIKHSKGCLLICFIIPSYCSLHAYEIAKSNCFKLRHMHIQYLKIGNFHKINTVNLTKCEKANYHLKKISSILSCKLFNYVCIILLILRMYPYVVGFYICIIYVQHIKYLYV